jgi:hypothetical protein
MVVENRERKWLHGYVREGSGAKGPRVELDYEAKDGSITIGKRAGS